MNELLTSNQTSYQLGSQLGTPDVGMKDFSMMLRRRKWVILPILLLSVGGAYLWTLNSPKTWRAEAQMMLVQRAPTTTSDTINGDTAPIFETMETQVGMIESVAMAQRTQTQLQNDALASGGSTSIPYSLGDIQNAIKVNNPLDSTLMDITAEANDRQQAAILANAVTHAFVLWKRDLAQNDILHSEESLRIRTARAKAQTLFAEQQLLAFKESHHLANVDTDEIGAITRQETADATVASIREDLASQQARLAEVNARLLAATNQVNLPGGVPDPGLVLSLQAKLEDLVVERNDLAQKVTPEYPGALSGLDSLPDLDAKIADVKSKLASALKATTNNAAPTLDSRSALATQAMDARISVALTSARLAAALQDSQSLAQKVEGLPDIRMHYAQLSRNADLANALYTSLQSALNATHLERDRVSGNIQITEGAIVPYLPYKPNLKTNLAIGLAIGVLLSLGLIMLLEQIDQRVRTLDEVRALATGPIVGMLPKTSRAHMRMLTQGRLVPAFEEAFNLLGVNLFHVTRQSMMREDLQNQIILVTSAVPKEGKSLIASQLARSMAESGKTVILVDANMRRPVQHLLFKTGEQGGLADVLANRITLDDALFPSDIAGLSILAAGEVDQNPTVLLSQPTLATLIDSLRFKAEAIIIDAPDCTAVADTLLLTNYADCLLQVVRAGYEDMDTLHNATLALQATGKKVTILMNGLNRQEQHIFRSRYAYTVLVGPNIAGSLSSPLDKTMVMNRSRDLIFAKSVRSTPENPDDGTDLNGVS